MFYLYALKDKSSDDYNGIETYVMELFEEVNLDWFPKDEALSLNKYYEMEAEKKKTKTMEEFGLDNKLKSLQEKMTSISMKIYDVT